VLFEMEALLPPELLQTVEDLDGALGRVEEQLSSVLPICTRDSFAQLSFVDRASTFFALSKTLTVLYSGIFSLSLPPALCDNENGSCAVAAILNEQNGLSFKNFLMELHWESLSGLHS
jgi:hypothetical protein